MHPYHVTRSAASDLTVYCNSSVCGCACLEQEHGTRATCYVFNNFIHYHLCFIFTLIYKSIKCLLLMFFQNIFQFLSFFFQRGLQKFCMLKLLNGQYLSFVKLSLKFNILQKKKQKSPKVFGFVYPGPNSIVLNHKSVVVLFFFFWAWVNHNKHWK